MSAIICFDIRNFSTHFSHLSAINKTHIIFNVIEEMFISLGKIINHSRKILSLSAKEKTFINHTGDGFVAILCGQGKSLQSLFVASLIANEVEEILKKFNYQSEYPGNKTIAAFLGNGINLSNRVQESTKDHTFPVICTKVIYEEAISVIKGESIEKYFKELGRHKLRGRKKPVTLYGVKKVNLANDIELICSKIFRTSKTENRKQKTGS